MKSSSCSPSNLATAYARNRCSEFYPCIPLGRQKTLYMSTARRKRQCPYLASAVFRNRSSISDNGASDSARALLERLFIQTQKLEEKMTGSAQVAYDIDLSINLGTLESDLQAALQALKQKEEDLHEAERTVRLEHAQLSRVKEEVDERLKEITAVCSEQEELENDLRLSSVKRISQAKEIEDLKLRLKEREQEILSMEDALCSKEKQLHGIRGELMQNNAEVAKVQIDLQVKVQILNDTEEVVRRQETELLELQDSLKEKETNLDIALTQRELEEEKTKAMEAMLSKQMMAWLLAQEELRKLGDYGTTEDFQRVKKLLVAMRSELVCSQKSLASSRERMEEQEVLVLGQLAELEEQKKSVMTHVMSLKDAHAEVEDERFKLRVSEARNKELGQSLLIERDLVRNLQKELHKEKSSACEVIEEVTFLRKELHKKTAEFVVTSNILHLKESELGEAKLEIQHLESELSSLEHALEERDSELHVARKRLEEVNAEIAELRMLMKSKEDQLIQATSLLKEKDDYACAVQGELNATKLKFTEAEHVVERIVNLTSKLVASAQEEHNTSLGLNAKEPPTQKPTDYHQWHMKDLDTGHEPRGSLRSKEEEELKAVVEKNDFNEVELKREKDGTPIDVADLKIRCSMAQERINGGIVADTATKKLRLEAAEHELEAAAAALRKLEEVSRALSGKLASTTTADPDVEIFSTNGSDPLRNLTENNGLSVFSSEIGRLSKLTEQLVVEAGIQRSAL